MTALAVLLMSVGLADLVPRWKWPVGTAAAFAAAWALGAQWHTIWLGLICTIVITIWLDAATQRRPAGLIVLAVTAAGFLISSSASFVGPAPIRGWYQDLPIQGLAGVSLDRAALALGVVLFLATAANVVVRQALRSVGPDVLSEENSLRGGRLLGPLERWLVFGFAAGGHVGALGVLVAAKGILRFPEISQDRAEGMRAEYVLIGSFVSWSLALVFVPLL